jgi:hypothetical protein
LGGKDGHTISFGDLPAANAAKLKKQSKSSQKIVNSTVLREQNITPE